MFSFFKVWYYYNISKRTSQGGQKEKQQKDCTVWGLLAAENFKNEVKMKRVLDEDLIYEILSVVAEIPEGCVATYGQIARLIGREKNARLVGRVLSRAEYYGQYPCHRVVNHAGRMAPGWAEQAELLRREGVPLKDAFHVEINRCRWEIDG